MYTLMYAYKHAHICMYVTSIIEKGGHEIERKLRPTGLRGSKWMEQIMYLF